MTEAQDENGIMQPAPVPADFLIEVRSVDDNGIIRMRASDLAESLKMALTGCEPVKAARLNEVERRLALVERDMSPRASDAVSAIGREAEHLQEQVVELAVRVSNVVARVNDLEGAPKLDAVAEIRKLRKALRAALK